MKTSNVVSFRTRRYEAASQSTRTENWYTPGTDANSAITHRQILRNRARDLVRNNPWANKGLNVIVNNTIGYGIRAQWQAPSKRAVKQAQQLWKKWAETTQCDANGLTDFYGIQQQVMRCTVESGECLIRLRPRFISDGLAVPFQLQVLEADHLYDLNDGILPNGNVIQNGVEFDPVGRRVAYYLYKVHPGAVGRFMGAYSTAFSRVPASEIIHCFRQDRPGQERGVTWFAPVMIRLRELDIYEDAYLNRQKIANLFASFETAENTEEAAGDYTEIDELLPGTHYIMRPGRKIDFSEPPKADDYGPYTLANLRAVAAGLGITYESMTGDLSNVNFSSGRMGWQEMGRNVDAWRWQMFIPRVCHQVGDWFIQFAGIPGLSHEWTPPARAMLNPAQEVPAIKDAIRAGLMTQPEAIREQGYDPEQFFDEYQASNVMLDERGIVLDSDPRHMSSQGQAQSKTGNVKNDNTQQPAA